MQLNKVIFNASISFAEAITYIFSHNVLRFLSLLHTKLHEVGLRLMGSNDSLNPWGLINDMQMSMYNRKHWHALSHSLYFVRQEGRLAATHPPSLARKSGSRLPIHVFHSVCLGLVPGQIDSPYLIKMSWITILRDEYYTIVKTV